MSFEKYYWASIDFITIHWLLVHTSSNGEVAKIKVAKSFVSEVTQFFKNIAARVISFPPFKTGRGAKEGKVRGRAKNRNAFHFNFGPSIMFRPFFILKSFPPVFPCSLLWSFPRRYGLRKHFDGWRLENSKMLQMFYRDKRLLRFVNLAGILVSLQSHFPAQSLKMLKNKNKKLSNLQHRIIFFIGVFKLINDCTTSINFFNSTRTK